MKLWLAPLEGISDCAFRTLCYNHGADLTFTPMVRVESLVSKNKSSLGLVDLKNDTPTGIQILAVKVDKVREFVTKFDYDCDNICLNLGCPSLEVIREGSGAALIKRVSRVQEIVNVLRKLDLPVYIKLRLGLNEYEMKKKVYLNLIKNVEADGFILHAKHARENSNAKSHWEVFSENFSKHIIPNGDINTREDLKLFKDYKEVMIGRAALRNPSVFDYLKGEKLVDKEKIIKEYLSLVEKYDSKFKKNVIEWVSKDYK